MALSKDTREEILQEVEMDFTDQEPLQTEVMEEYADEIENEALQTAMDAGFPNITDMSRLSYTIDVQPQGSIEEVAEKWINFLEDISDNEEDLQKILANANQRREHFAHNASDYLNVNIEILESVEEFADKNPVETKERFAQRLEDDFSAEEYSAYLIEDAISSDALNEKIVEAYAEAGIEYNQENERTYGFKITDIQPKQSFEAIADRLAEKVQEAYDTVGNYLDAQFYRDLDADDLIDYRVMVDTDIENEDGAENLDFDPIYLDDYDIENIIKEEFDIKELKKGIAMDEGFTTDDELESAIDFDFVWDVDLERPSDYSVVEAEFKNALRNNGVKNMKDYDELDDIEFIYKHLYNEGLIYPDAEKDDRAYVLVYDLDADALRECISENEY